MPTVCTHPIRKPRRKLGSDRESDGRLNDERIGVDQLKVAQSLEEIAIIASVLVAGKQMMST